MSWITKEATRQKGHHVPITRQVKVSSPNEDNENEVENDSDEIFPDKDSTKYKENTSEEEIGFGKVNITDYYDIFESLTLTKMNNSEEWLSWDHGYQNHISILKNVIPSVVETGSVPSNIDGVLPIRVIVHEDW
jgi:hypothetical protein